MRLVDDNIFNYLEVYLGCAIVNFREQYWKQKSQEKEQTFYDYCYYFLEEKARLKVYYDKNGAPIKLSLSISEQNTNEEKK